MKSLYKKIRICLILRCFRNIFSKIFKKVLSDEIYLKIMCLFSLGRFISLKNPKKYNDKIQWMKIYYNTDPSYTLLVDKYRVREYVKDKIGEKYLIPLLGVWQNFDEIDFNSILKYQEK